MPQSKHKGSEIIGIVPAFFVEINVLTLFGLFRILLKGRQEAAGCLNVLTT